MEARKGPMTVLFHPENKSGNRDRQVHVSSGIEHYVPMSVFPSEAGSEVILALFHRPSITGKASEDEISSVTDALITLKRALEW